MCFIMAIKVGVRKMDLWNTDKWKTGYGEQKKDIWKTGYGE